MPTYTGVGSRSAPKPFTDLMLEIAERLSVLGFKFRSGASGNSDRAFEAPTPPNQREIYIPWENFGGLNSDMVGYTSLKRLDKKKVLDAWSMVKKVHPYWQNLKYGGIKLHTRNAFQVLGENLDDPSDFVVYWAPEKDGVVKGGTATAVNLARKYNIPTYNLNIPEEKDSFFKMLEQLEAA